MALPSAVSVAILRWDHGRWPSQEATARIVSYRSSGDLALVVETAAELRLSLSSIPLTPADALVSRAVDAGYSFTYTVRL